MSPKETIKRAADHIRLHGWTQGMYRDQETGAVCIMGALLLASGVKDPNVADDSWNDSAFGAWEAGDAMDDYLGLDVEDWNDAPGRTVEEVIAALEGASA